MDTQAIVDAIASKAAATGYFERVNEHEPVSPPGSGLTAAVWVDAIKPVRTSGLNSTSGLLTVMERIYSSVRMQPPDAIDPTMMDAVDALMSAYSGAFTLGGLIRDIDLHGGNGTPLSARAGYLTYDGGATYRVYTITIPCVVNDLWTQAP